MNTATNTQEAKGDVLKSVTLEEGDLLEVVIKNGPTRIFENKNHADAKDPAIVEDCVLKVIKTGEAIAKDAEVKSVTLEKNDLLAVANKNGMIRVYISRISVCTKLIKSATMENGLLKITRADGSTSIEPTCRY